MNFQSVLLSLLCLAIFSCPSALAQPVSDTAFTYQGELEQSGIPVSQQCDFEFSLWTGNNAPDPGVQVGPDVETTTQVDEGIFTAGLDFGADALDGTARWLNIAVCCATPCAPGYTELAPRQLISSSPFSVQTRGIFVDDSENVGIKTATPNAMLTVGSGDGATIHVGQAPQLSLSKDVPDEKIRVQVTGTGYGGYDLQIGRDDTGHGIILSGDVNVDGQMSFLDGYGIDGKLGVGIQPNVETMFHVNTDEDNYGVLVESMGFAGSRIGLHASSLGFSSLAKNAYFSGGWRRFNTGLGAFLQEVDPDGDTSFSSAPPGGLLINWNRAMVIKTDGRIGMGTNSPDVKLHVIGSQTIDGNQTVQGSSVVTGGHTVNGNQLVGGNAVVQGTLGIGVSQVNASCDDCSLIQDFCPAGTRVIGGGCGASDEDIAISIPLADGTGWTCATDLALTDMSLAIICARVQ